MPINFLKVIPQDHLEDDVSSSETEGSQPQSDPLDPRSPISRGLDNVETIDDTLEGLDTTQNDAEDHPESIEKAVDRRRSGRIKGIVNYKESSQESTDTHHTSSRNRKKE